MHRVTGWAILAVMLLFAPVLLGQEAGEDIIEMQILLAHQNQI